MSQAPVCCKCTPHGSPCKECTTSLCALPLARQPWVQVDNSSSSPNLSRVRSLLRKHVTGFKGSKIKPIKVNLVSVEFTNSSTAGSANALNSSLQFNTSNFIELPDFAAVYDEARLLNARLHYYPTITTAGTAPTAACAFAVEFDPTVGYASAPNAVLEAAYSAGPFRLHAGINGATIQSGDMLRPYRRIDGRPPCPLAPITSSDVPGNAWFAVDGSTAPTLAVFLGYINSLGTGGVSSCSWFWELEMEFRLRT